MAQSIWPRDISLDPFVPLRALGQLTCFVISPFYPKDRFDDLFRLIDAVCQGLREVLQLEKFACLRADEITSAGIIQPEIWEQIKHADLIVADVSGQNGNVMLELGVAAAWRKKEQVIILREQNPEEPHLFDINPARHLEYTRTAAGFEELKKKLTEAIFAGIAAAPFEEIPTRSITLPLIASLDKRKDCDDLWVPSISHRRMIADGLEFGSLYAFSHSWLAVGNLKIRKVRVKAEMRFTERRETKHKCWMGIMLRAQLFWANWGHLVLLRSDGTVARTARKSEDPRIHYDVELGRISDYQPEEFVPFELVFDDVAWNISVGPIKTRIPVDQLPFVFSTGRALFQTYQCRVGMRNLEVHSL